MEESNLFHFRWRVIEPWNTPDGFNFHSPSRSFLSWSEMRNPDPGTKTAQFVEDCRLWGYNGMSFYLAPEENLEATRTFAKYLRSNGIGMILRRDWYELEGKTSWPVVCTPELWGTQRRAEELCPYSARTARYWRERVEKDFARIPDLLGYRMNATEHIFCNGAPWMCDCEKCHRQTPRERTREAIHLLANLLAEHGGTLFWETCQDDPGGQHEETFCFEGLTGEIPDNALVVIKDCYWDYHPGYPRHPLFDRITTDADGKSPYMTSIQLAGEYRGVHKFPWSMVGDWSALMRDVVRTGQQGLWVMAIVEYDDWDHPLNKVNWYAASRFLRDPLRDPRQVSLDWATKTFGSEAAVSVVQVIDKMSRAAQGMFEFKGLWTQVHSRFPELLYLDSRLCGPCRQSPRRKGMMGHAWSLDMYSADRAGEIKAEPRTQLAFTPAPITEELAAEMLAEKNEAIVLTREAVDLWRSLEGRMDRSLHEQILHLLEGNIHDAILWRMAIGLYMDMKLGRLTEEQIDAVLSECETRRLKGTIVDDPLDPSPRQTDCGHEPSSLKFFAEQVREEINKPCLDKYWSERSGVDDALIDYSTQSTE